MRFKKHLELEHGLKQIEVIPLINVVLLLLIFFMFTSNFLSQPGMGLSLPKALTSDVVKAENIEIIVSAEGVIYFNGKAATVQELEIIAKQAGVRNQPILIKADKKASLGKLTQIWDLCRDAGVSRINIATDH